MDTVGLSWLPLPHFIPSPQLNLDFLIFVFTGLLIAYLERTVPRLRAVDQVDRPQRMNVMDYASKIISSTSTAAECQGRRDRRTQPSSSSH